MSTLTDRVARLREHRAAGEGFSLIEVLVALTIFALVGLATLPLLLTSTKATVKAKLETQAKNVAQLRVEKMRNLAYHVARQNGPYIDLLDLYFTQAQDASVTTFPDGSTGQFLASAPGTGGAPSGPAYRVTFPSVTGSPGFSQVVYSQFLRTTHQLATVPTGAGGYSSALDGFDTPPSQLLGVTVLTSWVRGNVTGTLRTYTEIADGKGSGALATSQARALALKVFSTSSDGTTLIGLAGEVKADGSVTDGSQASVQGTAASLEQLGQPEVVGAVGGSVAPPNPASTAGYNVPNTAAMTTGGSLGCGWGSFGRTTVENLSATTANGVPVAPASSGADMTAAGATYTASGILTNSSPCGGDAFAWRNQVNSPSYPAVYGIRLDQPLVWVEDSGGGGGLASGAVVGEAGVTGTSLLAIPKSISAAARARTRTVRLFPTSEYENGLVRVELLSSSLVCKSGAAPRATFSIRIAIGNSPSTTYSWDSATSATPPVLPDPATRFVTVGGVSRPLSDYLSWKLTTGISEGNSGVSTINQVFSLSAESAAVQVPFDLQLGALSCVAEDLR